VNYIEKVILLNYVKFASDSNMQTPEVLKLGVETAKAVANINHILDPKNYPKPDSDDSGNCGSKDNDSEVDEMLNSPFLNIKPPVKGRGVKVEELEKLKSEIDQLKLENEKLKRGLSELYSFTESHKDKVLSDAEEHYLAIQEKAYEILKIKCLE
tara:strand:- start:27 stop:491 length:465 start_codon:yes stop_codon:yes gene_type:complete